jgi:hypothetical protein
MYPGYIPDLSNIPNLSRIYPGFIRDDRLIQDSSVYPEYIQDSKAGGSLSVQELYNQKLYNSSINYALKHIKLINMINIIYNTSIYILESIQF